MTGPTLLVWPSTDLDGAGNMALDEAAMVLGRRGTHVLRTYGWSPACTSLGRNQPTAGQLGGRPAAGLRCGIDVVRRPTGGRSVFHGPELTYAFVSPERALGGPRALYHAVHAALSEALRDLGVPLDVADRVSSAELPLDQAECFVAPAPGEITCGGRKLVGSAQWRHRGAVLQHGSILFRNEQARATDTGEGGRGATSLEDLGVSLEAAGIRERFVARLEGVVDGTAARGEVPPEVMDRAADLEVRYRSAEWTWRR